MELAAIAQTPWRGRDLGGVASRIGRRGRDVRQPGGRREGDCEGHLSGRVGGHIKRPQVVLGLSRPVGIVAGVGVDIDAKRRVGSAAPEPALELAIGGGHDDREVLEIVRALARRGGVVRHPVIAEIDGLSGVGEDAIGCDRVADGEVARGGADHDSRPTVVGDQVARDGGRPTDRIAGGPPLDHDPGGLVRQGYGTGHVGADVVARHHVIGRAADRDSRVIIARDDVPLAGGIDADAVGPNHVARGASDDHHSAGIEQAGAVSIVVAIRSVGQGDIPADGRADEVARDHIAIGALALDQDANAVVARDQVPLGRIVDPVAIGPDEVVAGPPIDFDAIRLATVGFTLGAGGIGPQEVAIDPIVRGAGTREFNADACAEITDVVDVQAADGHARAGDRQTVEIAGALVVELGAVDLDQRRAGVARLGEAVDQHRAGDRGQNRERIDRLHAGAADIEVNRAGRPYGIVRIKNSLAERAGAAVAGVGHQEGGQQRPVLHDFQAGAEPEKRCAESSGRSASSTTVKAPARGKDAGFRWAEKSDHRSSSGTGFVETQWSVDTGSGRAHEVECMRGLRIPTLPKRMPGLRLDPRRIERRAGSFRIASRSSWSGAYLRASSSRFIARLR